MVAHRDLGGDVGGRVLVAVAQLASDGVADDGEGLGEGERPGAGQFVGLAGVAVAGEGAHRHVGDVLHVDEQFTTVPGGRRELARAGRNKSGAAKSCENQQGRNTVRSSPDSRTADSAPIAVVRPDPGLSALLDLITAEVEHDEQGQQVVLDRFLDLLLVRALRTWFADPGATPPPGYRALADPDIGHVLRRLHEEPARPWTVASLAGEAGVSRTAFARRFSALVGRPPLAYLTDWRMTLAADRLRAPRATVTAVAKEVGYADGFAFSAAFKRVRGVSPSAHRAVSRVPDAP